jgi:hypothetical protein
MGWKRITQPCDLCGKKTMKLRIQMLYRLPQPTYITVCADCIRRMVLKEWKKGGNNAEQTKEACR